LSGEDEDCDVILNFGFFTEQQFDPADRPRELIVGKVMFFLYFNLYVFGNETGRQEKLKKMVASIRHI
jgi:hypothetical protein